MSWAALAPYRAILGARFRTQLQYRAAAIAGVWTQLMFGLVLVMIYEAFYASAPAAAERPMTFAQVATYVWLGQALFAMLPWNSDAEVRELIRSGAVAYELCRPVDLYGLWYARAVALRVAPALLRSVPMVIFAMVILPAIGLPEWQLAPPTGTALLGFAGAVACAVALGAAITVLVNISLMWTVAGDGVAMLTSTAVALLSGMLVPLPLFPDWAQPILAWTPFAGLADLPFRIYTGALPLAELPLVLARQLAWTVALVALGRYLLGRGLRRVVVQGG